MRHPDDEEVFGEGQVVHARFDAGARSSLVLADFEESNGATLVSDERRINAAGATYIYVIEGNTVHYLKTLSREANTWLLIVNFRTPKLQLTAGYCIIHTR